MESKSVEPGRTSDTADLCGRCQARQAGKRVLVLVPEQFTLLMEREIMDGLHLPGLMDMKCYPLHSAALCLSRAGARPRGVLDGRGRAMALSRALLAQRDQLQYYQGAADTSGLPERLAALLGDMKKAGLTAERLAEHAQSLPPGAARAKESDLSRQWAGYDAAGGPLCGRETAEEEVIRRLPGSGIAAGAAVWVYGFDVLTRPMCHLLAVLGREADSLTVTLTMDTVDAEDGRIFKAQWNSAGLLMNILRGENVPGETVRAARQALPAAPALQYCAWRAGSSPPGGNLFPKALRPWSCGPRPIPLPRRWRCAPGCGGATPGRRPGWALGDVTYAPGGHARLMASPFIWAQSCLPAATGWCASLAATRLLSMLALRW